MHLGKWTPGEHPPAEAAAALDTARAFLRTTQSAGLSTADQLRPELGDAAAKAAAPTPAAAPAPTATAPAPAAPAASRNFREASSKVREKECAAAGANPIVDLVAILFW